MKYTAIHRFLVMVCRVAVVPMFGAGGALVSYSQDRGEDIVETMIEEQEAVEASARASQVEIARLDAEASQKLAEYREAMAELETLRIFNDQMENLVQSQESEMASIERQGMEIESTSREVVPLMQRMLETLEHFVALDMPFLVAERRTRVQNLQEIMQRADVTTSEKYRRILEAYGVEMEYGRTIESYRDTLVIGSEELTVDFLRLGRVALLFQSLDGERTGYWNKAQQRWVEDNSYDRSARQGLRIAKQQAAPDLLVMPVSGPGEL